MRIIWYDDNFRPFESRTDAVIGLSFRWDEKAINVIKEVLNEFRPVYKKFKEWPKYTSGGWLMHHKKWFIEPEVWPTLKIRLEREGYHILKDGGSNES